jgi:hypothetical protein
MNAQATISPNEVIERGQALYDTRIRAAVDTPQNHGKFVSIDVLSGDYEIGENHTDTTLNLRRRHPDPVIATLRIGFRAAFTRGGRMTPES